MDTIYKGTDMVANSANPRRISMSILMDSLKTLTPLKTSEETIGQRYWWFKFMEDLGHCFTQSNLPPTDKLFTVLRENWQFLNTTRKELAAHELKALKDKLS